MKLFLDTANIAEIAELAQTGLIDGVTTNPTHLSVEKNDPVEQIKAIIKLLPAGEISVEITEKDPEKVYAQALKIAALSDTILVKVPCHQSYYPIIGRLVAQGIPLNITLVFSFLQGVFMAKLGVRYISPFIGRLNDNDGDGIALLAELRTMIDHYEYTTKILAASIREVEHVHDAVLMGVDAVTCSPTIFKKMMHHQLTDSGMKQFDADWFSLGIKQFP